MSEYDKQHPPTRAGMVLIRVSLTDRNNDSPRPFAKDYPRELLYSEAGRQRIASEATAALWGMMPGAGS